VTDRRPQPPPLVPGSRLIEGTTKLCIVMEYMAGGSVADLLAAGGLLDEQSVRAVCRDLCLALEYLHSEGKIHRDVKAANVLLTSTGDVRLADFGVAAEVSRTLGAKRKTFTGTPFWMAPEVISQSAGAGGGGYDARADVWSLGITAWECAVGTPPHAEEHPMRVLFIIPKQPPPALGPQFSKLVRDFVAFVLVKDPQARPTAKEVLKHRAMREATRPSAAFLDRVAAAVQRRAAERAAAESGGGGGGGDDAADGAFDSPDSGAAYPTWDFGRKGTLGAGGSSSGGARRVSRPGEDRQAEMLALGGTVRMPATPRAVTEDGGDGRGGTEELKRQGSGGMGGMFTPGAAAAAADALHGQVLADEAALEADAAAAAAPVPAEGTLLHFTAARLAQQRQQQRSPDDDCVGVPLSPLARELLAKWRADVSAAAAMAGGL
jgi:hypothetical protein